MHLFTLIIYPLRLIIEFAFSLFYHVFKNPGAAIFGVSLAVTVMCLPLYVVAERWNEIERSIQEKLNPGIQRIKKAFKGDEQYMILTTFYRQNHYHPLMALRSSFSLLIQIPFFMAAYSYLSHLSLLQGESFLFLKDMSAPDALISLGSFNINILPVVMTLINCASGAVYSKGHGLREKLQIYIMAALFLFVLYDSPSGLVFYWTLNQIFSLCKNIFFKFKNPLKTAYFCMAAAILFADFYILFLHQGSFNRRCLLAFVISILLFSPILVRLVSRLIDTVFKPILAADSLRFSLFIFSCIGIALLTGFLIPSGIINSSVIEFFNIDDFGNPNCFVVNSLFQCIGLFILWPVCLYFLFNKRLQTCFSVLALVMFCTFILNAFAFIGHYGTLTRLLTFADSISGRSGKSFILVNLLADIAIIFAIFAAIKFNFGKILCYAISILTFAVFISGIFNVSHISKEYTYIEKNNNQSFADSLSPVLHLSKTGKNVVLFMLDRAESGFLEEIFKEDPSLIDIYTGFTFYPNTVSYGAHTIIGAPPLFGGYEYTPNEFNKRTSEKKIEKNNQALKVLPAIFGNQLDYEVTVTDTSWANYQWIPDMSIFDGMKNTTALSLEHTYTGIWMERNKDKIQKNIVSNALKRNMLMMSIFRCSPVVFRDAIYDDGLWWNTDTVAGDIQEFIDYYSVLDFLPELTDFSSEKDVFFSITNDTTHSGIELNPPDYVPSVQITGKGTSIYSDVAGYSANIASFKLLGKWIEYLKANGVYDNTRIIIASDHGIGKIQPELNQFKGKIIDFFIKDHLHPMLLVKDFNSKGTMKTDNTFMTNADVPLLLMKDLVENPVNPFTGNKMTDEIKRTQGAIVTKNETWSPDQHGAYTFNISDDEWYTVKDNIFEYSNWNIGK